MPQRVITKDGEHGVVVRLYDDFTAVSKSCKSIVGRDWLLSQIVPFTDENLKEMWVEVQIDEKGTIWCPSSMVTYVK